MSKNAYVNQVGLALQQANPNDSADEVWDDAAIKDLAYYLSSRGYTEQDLGEVDNLYTLYDLLKWTRYEP